MKQTQRSNGFTLIELMLAMTFIAILLVAITMTIIQISNIYNRGITLKEVNVAGRSIASELQLSVAASSTIDIQPIAGKYIEQGGANKWGGRLCLGQYSYIWNYGWALNSNDPNGTSLNTYAVNPAANLIRFVKVRDSNGSYCSNPSKKVVAADASELLNVGDHNLALHSLTITSESTAADTKSQQQLYTITYTIGTNVTAALLPNGSGCKEPGTAGSDLTYCAVQDFTVIARAGNVAE
jgi:prepilin-type N-terminal cleavage/methylation domain-containing protein